MTLIAHSGDGSSIQAHDLVFRQVYAFFVVPVASRRVGLVAATRHPTQAWTVQQLRNATMRATSTKVGRIKGSANAYQPIL